MTNIVQKDIGDISPQMEQEFTSPLSPKRLRTDCTAADIHRFDFPEISTFWKSVGCTSLGSELQGNAAAVCKADTEFTVKPINNLTISHTNAHTEAYFPASEPCFPHVVKDEHPQVTESDKLSSHPLDNAGGALAESHALKDASAADTSSHPDYKRLGESLEDEPPGSTNLPTGNDEEGRQVQNSVRPIRAFTRSSSDEVTCWSDCSCEEMRRDTCFSSTWSQTGEGEDGNQRRGEDDFTEKVPLSKKKEESPTCSCNDVEMKSLQDSPGNSVQEVKNKKEVLELQICENETVFNGDIKDQVNGNSPCKKFIPSVACAEASVVSCDVLLERSNASESRILKTHDSYGADREHAAGEMIAEARSDHTMLARISQEPAEGDNDAGPFSVIDPTIWSETDREAEEERCDTQSSAGAELSPSVEAGETKTPLPLPRDIGPSLHEASAPNQTLQLNQRSGAQQCENEKDDLCQSSTEKPQARSAITDRTHNDAGCLWKSIPSSSPELPPAGRGRQESHDTAGCQFRVYNPSDSFPVSLDLKKTQEVEYSQTEIARKDRTAEMRRGQDVTSFEGEVESHGKSENLTDLKERLWQENETQREGVSEISAGLCIDSWAAGEGNRLTHFDEELGNNFQGVCDHPDTAVTPTMDEKTEENVPENGPQTGLVTEVSPDDCISKWAEGDTSKSDNKLSPLRQHSVACKDVAFSFSAASDAVVPASCELIPLQTAAALNCADSFSLVPSAFSCCNCALGGFDTFEKIQLSNDGDANDDDDAVLSNPSLPGQPLETHQWQLHHLMPDAERNEEEVERLECDSDNMANVFLSSDYSSDELKPAQEEDLNPHSVSSSSPASDVDHSTKFKMKQEFDVVLKELKLYFDISMSEFSSDSRASSPEQSSDVPEVQEEATNCKEQTSSPHSRLPRDTSSDDPNENPSLEVCRDDPVLPSACGSGDGEQEVPIGSRHCPDISLQTREMQREPLEAEQKRRTASPTFMFGPFSEQVAHRLPELIAANCRRLEPLKTCTRPIRVGLSKRAKTKHLHRPHPYK